MLNLLNTNLFNWGSTPTPKEWKEKLLDIGKIVSELEIEIEQEKQRLDGLALWNGLNAVFYFFINFGKLL